MKNFLPMYLALFCASGQLLAAAEDNRSSMERVMHLMTFGIQESIKTESPELYEGIQYFRGTSQRGRNFHAAQTFFFKAKNNSDVQIRTKACLYNAVILFLGGYGVDKNPAGAKYFVQSIVNSESAADDDRIRACLLLDEMMHTSDSGVPLELSVLRACTSAVAHLGSGEGGLSDELCYRIARGFTYDDGREHKRCLTRAAMCLNALFHTGNIHNSLARDIEILRHKIAAQGSSIQTFGLLHRSSSANGIGRCESPIPCSSQPIIQAPTPVRFLGGLIPEHNYVDSLQYDQIWNRSAEILKDDGIVQKGFLKRSPATIGFTSLEKEASSESRSRRLRIFASKLRLERSATPENAPSSSSVEQDPFQERAIRLDRPLTPEDWRAIRKAKHARDATKRSKSKKSKKNRK